MIKIFTALLRSEICKEALEEEIVRQITSQDLEQLYNIAKKHDLAHIIGTALKEQHLLKDDDVSKKFMQSIYWAMARTEKIKYEQNRIYELFEREQVAFIPLKGAVIREYYEKSWQRTSCDIDILVKQEELEKAKEKLVSCLKYSVQYYNYHDISLYSPSGIHLELHFSIMEHKDNIDFLLKKVWDYVHLIDSSEYHYAMSQEYFMFHLLAHMLHHFLEGGCGMRFFVDIWLLRQQVEYEQNKLDILCDMCGILTFARYVWKLTDIWFADAVHDETTLSMQSYVFAGGIYGSRQNLMTVTKSKTDRRGKYVLKRLVSSYSDLVILFPNLKKFPFLYPYYMVKRWRKVFETETFDAVKEEMQLYGQVGQDKVREVKWLLRRLGL